MNIINNEVYKNQRCTSNYYQAGNRNEHAHIFSSNKSLGARDSWRLSPFLRKPLTWLLEIWGGTTCWRRTHININSHEYITIEFSTLSKYKYIIIWKKIDSSLIRKVVEKFNLVETLIDQYWLDPKRWK
jgi:hypothetical protein